MNPIVDIISGLFKPATELVSDLVTTKKEKLEMQAVLMKIENDLVNKMLDYESKLLELKSGIIEAEAKGNWLQRSWRPIIMLLFGFIIIYEYFIAKIFSLPPALLPAEFWELLKIGMGGYIIGRSAEKIIPKINLKKSK